jgi:hypothetical protein
MVPSTRDCVGLSRLQVYSGLRILLQWTKTLPFVGSINTYATSTFYVLYRYQTFGTPRSQSSEVTQQKSLSGASQPVSAPHLEELLDLQQFVGAGSVIQHIIAEDGETTPQLFRAAMTSSTFLPSLHVFNDTVPQVRIFSFYAPYH